MNLLLKKRLELCSDIATFNVASGAYWGIVSMVKRQCVGPFVLCSLYLSSTEFDVWIE